MDQQVKNAIRHLVFTFLDNNSSDLQNIKWKDLRGFIEAELKLPASTCKTEPYKGMISTYINRFLQVKNTCEDIRIIQAGGATAALPQGSQDSATEAVKIVKGRFTKKEVEKVLEAVKDFCEQEGVTPQDLINFYHDTGKAPVKTRKWVGFIRQRLPYRDAEAIKKFVVRKVIREDVRKSTFTDKEKETLVEMVKVHGRSFLEIGKLMNKLPDDCQQIYIRLQRKKLGYYTVDEDVRIIRAVLDFLKMPGDTEVLPDSSISWTHISELMEKERIPLDYQRRYKTLLFLNHRYMYVPHIRPQQRGVLGGVGGVGAGGRMIVKAVKAPDEINMENFVLLRQLKEMNADDESEVRWAVLDKALDLQNTGHLWRMLCRECPSNNAEVVSFSEKLDFLFNKYEQVIRTAAGVDEDDEEPAPAASHEGAVARGAEAKGKGGGDSAGERSSSAGEGRGSSQLSQSASKGKKAAEIVHEVRQKAVKQATEVLEAKGLTSPQKKRKTLRAKEKKKSEPVFVDLVESSSEEEADEDSDNDIVAVVGERLFGDNEEGSDQDREGLRGKEGAGNAQFEAPAGQSKDISRDDEDPEEDAEEEDETQDNWSESLGERYVDDESTVEKTKGVVGEDGPDGGSSLKSGKTSKRSKDLSDFSAEGIDVNVGTRKKHKKHKKRRHSESDETGDGGSSKHKKHKRDKK